MMFSNRTTGEQLVNKGALRVRLHAPETGAVFNVIGTHMQATDSSLQVNARCDPSAPGGLVHPIIIRIGEKEKGGGVRG